MNLKKTGLTGFSNTGRTLVKYQYVVVCRVASEYSAVFEKNFFVVRNKLLDLRLRAKPSADVFL